MDLFKWTVIICIILGVKSEAFAHGQLERPLLCARWFNNGNVLERPSHNQFINVERAGTANLRSQFAYFMVEGRRSHVAVDHSAPPSQARNFLQTLVTRSDLHDTKLGPTEERVIQTLVANSDIVNLTDTNFNVGYIKDLLAATLRYLYKRYAYQRIERSGNIVKYRSQDRRKATRTTRFTQLVNDEVISHVQVETSLDRRSKLNFQEVFPKTLDPNSPEYVKIESKEVVHEIERFEVVKHADLGTETLIKMGELGLDRDLLSIRTLQKVITWLNHDVGADRVFYYCSLGTQRVLERDIPHLKYVKRVVVQQEKKPGQEEEPRPEILYDLSRDDLVQIENFLMAKIIEHHFLQDLPHLDIIDRHAPVTWNWMFWPNELSVLKRIHVGQLSSAQSGSDILKDAFMKYLRYRKANDIRYLLSDFLAGDYEILGKVRESLMVTLDYFHVQQLAAYLSEVNLGTSSDVSGPAWVSMLR